MPMSVSTLPNQELCLSLLVENLLLTNPPTHPTPAKYTYSKKQHNHNNKNTHSKHKSKGHRFDFQQENYLLKGQFSVLTVIFGIYSNPMLQK